MIDFIKGLFTPKGIAVNGLDMVDKAFFTNQEKSAFMVEWYKSSTPMALARRVLACMVGLVWFASVIVAGFLFLTNSGLYSGWSEFMTLHVNEPFKWVMGFYFLYKVLGK